MAGIYRRSEYARLGEMGPEERGSEIDTELHNYPSNGGPSASSGPLKRQTFSSILPLSSNSTLHTRESHQNGLFVGWRVGALASASVAIAVLFLNISVTIAFVTKYGINGGRVIISQGQCDRVKNLNKLLHLVINALSTILLCCSNYCMQSISAPTREELVNAHKRRVWLHIGTQSIRNLFYIGRNRVHLWLLLLLSSLPLHLLFNSAVFASLQANEYSVLPANERFLNGSSWDTVADGMPSSVTDAIIPSAARIGAKFINNTVNYKNQSTEECFRLYSNQYVSSVGDVILIQDTLNGSWKPAMLSELNSSWWGTDSSWLSVPYLSSPSYYPSNIWTCPTRNPSRCNNNDTSKWSPFNSTVKYCLTEIVDEQNCKLQFSLTIALLVIVSNTIKASCMLYIVLKCRDKYLVTLGDALAVFLQHPDPGTKGRCLYDMKLIKQEWNWMFANELTDPEAVKPEPEIYEPRRQRWAKAATSTRWATVLLLFLILIIFAAVFIQKSVAGVGPANAKELWQSGIGSPKGNNLLSLPMSVIGATILANIPQALLSYFYLFFNGILTSMLVGEEWNHYYLNRKPLRVSSPKGLQRSTYWLQSLFMVLLDVLTDEAPRQVNQDQSVASLGYSPVAIILTTLVGTLIVLFGFTLALRRYPAGMPLAGSCSAVISAACHPPKGDTEAAESPVQWGVVRSDVENAELQVEHEDMGHCSFTSFDATELIPGRKYQ